MKTKSPRKVELPEKVVDLLEEAYIAGWHLGPLDAERFREEFAKENPLVYITSLFLAAIDDSKKPHSVTIESLFLTASLSSYSKRAREILGQKD